ARWTRLRPPGPRPVRDQLEQIRLVDAAAVDRALHCDDSGQRRRLIVSAQSEIGIDDRSDTGGISQTAVAPPFGYGQLARLVPLECDSTAKLHRSPAHRGGQLVEPNTTRIEL